MNLKSRPPLLYLITDRRTLGQTGNNSQSNRLITFLEQAMAGGVDMVQLREPDVSARDLYLLAKSTVELAAQYRTAVLINDRADVAAACGAGVHLTTRSVRPAVIRRAYGRTLLMGVSTHNIDEVQEAQNAGADFVVFGPVYDTASKRQYGPTVGLGALRDAALRFECPVLGLGGINQSNFQEVLKAGAAGIAGISMFTNCHDLASLVRRVKEVKSHE